MYKPYSAFSPIDLLQVKRWGCLTYKWLLGSESPDRCTELFGPGAPLYKECRLFLGSSCIRCCSLTFLTMLWRLSHLRCTNLSTQVPVPANEMSLQDTGRFQPQWRPCTERMRRGFHQSFLNAKADSLLFVDGSKGLRFFAVPL